MNEDIVSSLQSRFKESIVSASSENKTTSIKVKKDSLWEILALLKESGFDHLSDITCVDYLAANEFELIYHLWSHGKKCRAEVKVRVEREAASVRSVFDLWSGAQLHERENHELFGVVFEGNPDLSPLFLEDWNEMPPFRKDFDSRAYVKREYYADGR